jgi:glycine betaine/proline transport system substrate-binding protein
MADQAAAGSSMATNGQPAVAPELWITRIAEIWNAGVKAQKLRSAGPTFEDSVFEGWFVPDYVATAQPDVTSMEGLKRHWESFAPSGGKGRFLSCPLDWACSVVNRNLLAAFGLDAFFEVVEPANRFEMDTLIAEAVGRKEPLLFYYWRPNAVLAQFGFKRIDLGPFERDAYQCAGRRVCDTPAPTGFPAEPVVIALAEWVYTEATQVAAYFQRARLPVAEMNAMLEQLGEPGATAETVADRFVAERESVWRAWVGAAP